MAEKNKAAELLSELKSLLKYTPQSFKEIHKFFKNKAFNKNHLQQCLTAYRQIERTNIEASIQEMLQNIPSERLAELANTPANELIVTSAYEMQMLMRRYNQVHVFTSANCLLFCEGKLVLLNMVSTAQDRATIPEKGQYRLPGGANGDHIQLGSAQYMWRDLVQENLTYWLGLNALDFAGMTEASMCEYPMAEIEGDLGSPFGVLHPSLARSHRKRQSHVAVAHIEKDVLDSAVLHESVKSVCLVTFAEFRTLLQKTPESLSFPHEVRAVLSAFEQKLNTSLHFNARINQPWLIEKL